MTPSAGLQLKPDAAYIEANLAHGLLLTGHRQEAIEHYMKVRKGTLHGPPMLGAIREDFGVLKSLSFVDPQMDSILNHLEHE